MTTKPLTPWQEFVRTPAAPTLDLTSASDPAGTCPSCRGGALRIEVVPFGSAGPRPRYAHAATCRRCGYVHEVPAGARIVGVGTVPHEMG